MHAVIVKVKNYVSRHRPLVLFLSCFGKEVMNKTFRFALGILILRDLQIRALVVLAVAHSLSSPF